MAKAKRYDDGGMTDEDVKSFAGTPENESNAGMAEATETKSEVAPAKATSFKSAFAAARGAGDKTFEWNGKKYTTEMAGSSKPSAPKSQSTGSRIPVPEPVKAKTEDAKPKYQSLADRAKSYADERAKSGTGMYGTKTNEAKKADADAAEETRRLRNRAPAKGRGVIDTKNVRENTLLPMKKGGAVKGWGSARGARKAKIY